MKGVGMLIWLMDMGDLLIPTEEFIREIGFKIKQADLGHIFKRTE